jgi:hypothetical protein
LQPPPPSTPIVGSGASTTGTCGLRPRRRVRHEAAEHVWAVPVRQGRWVGQSGCARTPTPGCRGRSTHRAAPGLRYQKWRIEYWRSTAGCPEPSRNENRAGPSRRSRDPQPSVGPAVAAPSMLSLSAWRIRVTPGTATVFSGSSRFDMSRLRSSPTSSREHGIRDASAPALRHRRSHFHPRMRAI